MFAAPFGKTAIPDQEVVPFSAIQPDSFTRYSTCLTPLAPLPASPEDPARDTLRDSCHPERSVETERLGLVRSTLKASSAGEADSRLKASKARTLTVLVPSPPVVMKPRDTSYDQVWSARTSTLVHAPDGPSRTSTYSTPVFGAGSATSPFLSPLKSEAVPEMEKAALW